ncbi:hypothetical protein [uncultured Fenollaria sp.]|uniref:hypothetical protein n=1 Tax=uncultured Fenollaria sp. TaxID=1686315 RepID=UPI0025ED8DCF|nr:hypothetical protein [uncultured Fenollaria sp.]
MITILKEAEVKGAVEFIPSAENLKELSDAALEMTMDNADKLDEIKASIDVIMMSIAELQEAHDADGEEPKDVKGDDEDVKNKN